MQQNQNLNYNGNLSLDDYENSYDDYYKNPYDFSKFVNLADFTLDEELLARFQPVARKLNLSQESVELLLDIAYQMSKKQDKKFHDDLNLKQISLIEEYNQMFDDDEEIPDKNSLKIRQFMSVADDAYNTFASPMLKETISNLGLNFHPELIKMFYRIGRLMQEDNMNYSNKPPVQELTPAQILYGKRD